jgi:hypothetical protein
MRFSDGAHRAVLDKDENEIESPRLPQALASRATRPGGARVVNAWAARAERLGHFGGWYRCRGCAAVAAGRVASRRHPRP